jgi:hypothetical protein
MYDVRVFGLTELNAKLTNYPQRIFEKLRTFVATETGRLASGVRHNITDRFTNPTGALLESIDSDVSATTNTVTGRVYSEGVPYAALLEYGGKFKLPDVRPVNAQALLFGRLALSPVPTTFREGVFSKLSRAHEVTVPEKSYARAALASIRSEFIGGIREIVAQAEQ